MKQFLSATIISILTFSLKAQETINYIFTIETDIVMEGLVHQHFISDTIKGSPLNILLLRINLDKVNIAHVLAMDQVLGQETTSQIVKRYNALAGINGGFCYSNNPWNPMHGDPGDFFVLNGVILSEPHSSRASFGIYHDPLNNISTPFFDQLQLSSTVEIDNKSIPVSGINRIRNIGEAILYTPEFSNTTMTDKSGIEIISQNQKVKKVIHNRGSSLIPNNGFVISIEKKLVEKYNIDVLPGSAINVKHQLTSLLYPEKIPALKNTSYNTAGPILVLDGQIVSNHSQEDIPIAFVNTRHPRTAVGITKDQKEILFVVVDGRQQRLSIGMTLHELAKFLLNQGAYQAYNLDGGGSSTMVIADRIVNSPSDPHERRRCDAVLVLKKNKTDM